MPMQRSCLLRSGKLHLRLAWYHVLWGILPYTALALEAVKIFHRGEPSPLVSSFMNQVRAMDFRSPSGAPALARHFYALKKFMADTTALEIPIVAKELLLALGCRLELVGYGHNSAWDGFYIWFQEAWTVVKGRQPALISPGALMRQARDRGYNMTMVDNSDLDHATFTITMPDGAVFRSLACRLGLYTVLRGDKSPRGFVINPRGPPYMIVDGGAELHVIGEDHLDGLGVVPVPLHPLSLFAAGDLQLEPVGSGKLDIIFVDSDEVPQTIPRCVAQVVRGHRPWTVMMLARADFDLRFPRDLASLPTIRPPHDDHAGVRFPRGTAPLTTTRSPRGHHTGVAPYAPGPRRTPVTSLTAAFRLGIHDPEHVRLLSRMLRGVTEPTSAGPPDPATWSADFRRATDPAGAHAVFAASIAAPGARFGGVFHEQEPGLPPSPVDSLTIGTILEIFIFGTFTGAQGPYCVAVGVEPVSKFSWIALLNAPTAEQCAHVARLFLTQMLARRAWSPASSLPSSVVFTSPLSWCTPPSMTLDMLDSDGTTLLLTVNLLRRPSDGSYVSTAEATAWHVLARADHFLRQGDLSLELLPAMLHAACYAFNASPKRYHWGHGSSYDLWHVDRVCMTDFPFVPGTAVCFDTAFGVECGLYIAPYGPHQHHAYNLSTSSLTATALPLALSHTTLTALRSSPSTNAAFVYPQLSVNSASALGSPILMDGHLALAHDTWITSRTPGLRRASSPPRSGWIHRGGVPHSYLWSPTPCVDVGSSAAHPVAPPHSDDGPSTVFPEVGAR